MTAAMASAHMALGSLLFHCEVEERTSNPRDVQPAIRSREQLSQVKEKLAILSTPASISAGKLLRDVRYFVKEEQDSDAVLLASKLSAVGYLVNVRTALGGGPACFRNLRHEFLTVRIPGDYENTEFIVEPRFREHFLIPHPTDDYTEILNSAPDVFVGAGARLVPIVQMLCVLMAESFQLKALTLPPWRRTESMLSKWLPNRARDTSFGRSSAPPHQQQQQCAQLSSLAGTQPGHGVTTPGLGRAQQADRGGSGQTATAPEFSRISDPLWLAAAQRQQQQQQQVTQAAAAAPAGERHAEGDLREDLRREDWGYSASVFIPFGGCGGCSSDTEAPSPPADGVSAAPPRPQPGQQDAAPQAPNAAAVAAFRRRQSSLLASHLQGQGQGQGNRAMQSRPPAHWGEAPMHTVRLGFQVAQGTQQGAAAVAPATAAVASGRGGGEQGKGAEQVPEASAQAPIARAPVA